MPFLTCAALTLACVLTQTQLLLSYSQAVEISACMESKYAALFILAWTVVSSEWLAPR